MTYSVIVVVVVRVVRIVLSPEEVNVALLVVLGGLEVVVVMVPFWYDVVVLMPLVDNGVAEVVELELVE